MANKTISELDPIGSAQIDRQNDLVPIVDFDQDKTKKMTIAELSATLFTDVYDVSMFIVGALTPNRLLARHIFVREVGFPLNFVGSAVRAESPPTSAVTLKIRSNGVDLGTIEFQPNSSSAVITCPATTFPTGGTLDIIGPSVLDMSLSDLAITFRGIRQ